MVLKCLLHCKLLSSKFATLFTSIGVKLLGNKLISASAETWKLLAISSLLAPATGRGADPHSAEPPSAEPTANLPKGFGLAC